jgi:hypothetical protein
VASRCELVGTSLGSRHVAGHGSGGFCYHAVDLFLYGAGTEWRALPIMYSPV